MKVGGEYSQTTSVSTSLLWKFRWQPQAAHRSAPFHSGVPSIFMSTQDLTPCFWGWGLRVEYFSVLCSQNTTLSLYLISMIMLENLNLPIERTYSTILCLRVWCSHQILTYPPMALDLTFHPIIMKKEPSTIWAKAYWQFIYLRHIGFSFCTFMPYIFIFFNFICVSLTSSNQPHQWSH